MNEHLDGSIVAETDDICDICLRDVEEGETMYKIKSRMGHHLVCDMCRILQPPWSKIP